MYDLLIKNARISSEREEVCEILSVNGKICEAGKFANAQARKVFDADGLFVVPAFLDMHFHGAGGADFCDASADGIGKICKCKLREGVSAIVPATLSLPESEIAKALETADAYVKNGEKFCRFFGAHIEGPFLNPSMSGAQNPIHLSMPDIGFAKRISKIFKVSKLSYSPELSPGFSAELLALGIVPSCVHSAATYLEFMKAYEFGLRNISHFGNRLSPITSRDIGATGAGFLYDDIFIEIIADGRHLSEDMLKLILAKKPHDKIALVTDSIRASGMPEGEYDLGGMNVFVKDGDARLANGALAGSVLKMNEAVKRIMNVGGLSLEKAASMASYVPAQSLGIKNFGKIEKGYFADFTVLDCNAEVAATIVGGEVRFSS